MKNALAWFGAKAYPYIWPVAFIAMGILVSTGTHVHFEIAGLDLTTHTLMWFMMGLAHADIFWRGWCAGRTAKV